MSKVIFTGRFGMRSGSENEYVGDIPAKVRELLAKGVRINIKDSAKTVQPTLIELTSFPEEEDESKMITRYGLMTRGGRKAFVSYKKAEDHWKRYYGWRPGAVLDILEVEVKA